MSFGIGNHSEQKHSPNQETQGAYMSLEIITPDRTKYIYPPREQKVAMSSWIDTLSEKKTCNQSGNTKW